MLAWTVAATLVAIQDAPLRPSEGMVRTSPVAVVESGGAVFLDIDARMHERFVCDGEQRVGLLHLLRELRADAIADRLGAMNSVVKVFTGRSISDAPRVDIVAEEPKMVMTSDGVTVRFFHDKVTVEDSSVSALVEHYDQIPIGDIRRIESFLTDSSSSTSRVKKQLFGSARTSSRAMVSNSSVRDLDGGFPPLAAKRVLDVLSTKNFQFLSARAGQYVLPHRVHQLGPELPLVFAIENVGVEVLFPSDVAPASRHRLDDTGLEYDKHDLAVVHLRIDGAAYESDGRVAPEEVPGTLLVTLRVRKRGAPLLTAELPEPDGVVQVRRLPELPLANYEHGYVGARPERELKGRAPLELHPHLELPAKQKKQPVRIIQAALGGLNADEDAPFRPFVNLNGLAAALRRALVQEVRNQVLDTLAHKNFRLLGRSLEDDGVYTIRDVFVPRLVYLSGDTVAAAGDVAFRAEHCAIEVLFPAEQTLENEKRVVPEASKRAQNTGVAATDTLAVHLHVTVDEVLNSEWYAAGGPPHLIFSVRVSSAYEEAFMEMQTETAMCRLVGHEPEAPNYDLDKRDQLVVSDAARKVLTGRQPRQQWFPYTTMQYNRVQAPAAAVAWRSPPAQPVRGLSAAVAAALGRGPPAVAGVASGQRVDILKHFDPTGEIVPAPVRLGGRRGRARASGEDYGPGMIRAPRSYNAGASGPWNPVAGRPVIMGYD